MTNEYRISDPRPGTRPIRKPTATPQIPCCICYQPAYTTDQVHFREARCNRGHITLTDSKAMAAHTTWIATRLQLGPAIQ